MKILYKALILPVAPNNKLLIQDRRGYKPPPWGFFGGSIEDGETPIEAVIRETEEELAIKLSESDLINKGVFPGAERDGFLYKNHVFIWKFDGDLSRLTLLEGKDMKLLPFKDAYELISMDPDKIIILNCLLRYSPI